MATCSTTLTCDDAVKGLETLLREAIYVSAGGCLYLKEENNSGVVCTPAECDSINNMGAETLIKSAMFRDVNGCIRFKTVSP